MQHHTRMSSMHAPQVADFRLSRPPEVRLRRLHDITEPRVRRCAEWPISELNDPLPMRLKHTGIMLRITIARIPVPGIPHHTNKAMREEPVR